MANQLTPIASTVLIGTAASVTFSSISGAYTDLVLKVSARSDFASTHTYFSLRFNADSSALYSDTYLEGDGATAGSARDSGATIMFGAAISGGSATANTFGTGEIYIPNYAGTGNKPVSIFSAAEHNAASVKMDTTAGLYRNAVALTSVVVSSNNGLFVAGSRFDLYGILKI